MTAQPKTNPLSTRRLLLLAAVLLVLPGTLLSGTASADDNVVNDATQKAQNEDVNRMYISVDKPIYRPGETMWFRSWELSLRNINQHNYSHEVTFQLYDPRGSVVAEKLVLSQGIGAWNDIELDPNLVGGEYTLVATGVFGSTQRPVIVSVYEPPRIKKTLEFVRKAHGPGDTVRATIELERGTGEALGRAPFTALVMLDDAEIHRIKLETDQDGEALIKFDLPAEIARGDGLLTVLVDDGGVTESIQRRIPITVEKIDLAVYPEGGDLITGLESRVYFQAKSLIGKPIDIEGRIVNSAGKVVSNVKTFHNGMGRFNLKPKKDESYELIVTRPTTVKQSIKLPAAKADGCVMQTKDDFLAEKTEVEVHVACTEDTDIVLAGAMRGQLLAYDTEDGVDDDGETLTLDLQDKVDQGALRLTVYNKDSKPIAERLVYRGLRKGLKVEIESDKEMYQPRDQVTLNIKVTDEDGNPVQGEFALSVVDDTVLNYADDKTGHMLAQILLLPEMPGQYIDEPNFYFSDHENAPRAMDLLLGTQGWRRFAQGKP